MRGEIALILIFLGFCRLDLACTSEVTEFANVRSERQILPAPPIVYPFGGNFKLIIGFAVPIELPGRILVYGQNIQFQYPLPPNTTFFTNYFDDAFVRRRRRNVARNERMLVYRFLENEYDRKGIDGKECLKKSICEAAVDPVKDEGLIGELLHLLLTPNDKDTSTLAADYFEAAETGKAKQNCSKAYSCPTGRGILDQIFKLAT